MEHTPTPWEQGKAHPEAIYSGDFMATPLAYTKNFPHYTNATAETNAEFIVRAVNSHDALVEACKAALEEFTDPLAGTSEEADETLDKLEAAIAKAKKSES